MIFNLGMNCENFNIAQNIFKKVLQSIRGLKHDKLSEVDSERWSKNSG